MLKKMVLVLVVLSFVAIPAMAKEEVTQDGVYLMKAYSWPVEFKAVPIDINIPVFMKIGLFVKIANKKKVQDDGITLAQVDIDNYTGCSTALEIWSNFDVKLGGTFEWSTDGLPLKDDSKTKVTVMIVCKDQDCTSLSPVDCSCVPKTLSVAAEFRKVYVKVLKPKMWEVTAKQKIQIGTVTLTMKPCFDAPDWDP